MAQVEATHLHDERTVNESKWPMTRKFLTNSGHAVQKLAEVGTRCIGDSTDANFPVDAQGRVYHLGLKYGELANRIIIVGDPNRALLLANMFDDPNNVFTLKSNRGFSTFTGKRNGVPVSVMAIGMGIPMTDFMVREARHIIKGPIAVIRLGTCGTIRDDVPIGSITVAERAMAVTTNYDAFDAPSNGIVSSKNFYHLSKPVAADATLTRELILALEKAVEGHTVVPCDDATADSFYSSQGRYDVNFADHNETLIDDILAVNPLVGSLQMETFQLYHLARLSGSIASASCAIVLAQRRKNAFLPNDTKHALELAAGNACFEAIVTWNSGCAFLMDDDPLCVWNMPPTTTESAVPL